MQEQEVFFYSEGTKVAGLLRTPDNPPEGRMAGIVQGPGWLGLRDSKLYVRYHKALTDAGFAVLAIDYRGFGASEGERGLILPSMQLDDLINAVTYLTTRDDIDPERIGTFGSGGTGGGNSIMLAAHDSRVRCVVSQVPVADGEDWLRRMRRGYEWYEFLDRLKADRAKRVLDGQGEMVHPRDDIMIQTPERRQTKVKADVDGRIPTSVPLRCAEAVLGYKPVEVVNRIAPRGVMIIGVENDAVTPTDHATALYENAGSPKKLIMERLTSHYAAYDRYWTKVTPAIVDWFEQHLGGAHLQVYTNLDGTERFENVDAPEDQKEEA